jgi:glycerate 2-kinase
VCHARRVSRVVVAPDSFKGSISAVLAANAIGRGWATVRPSDELVLLPMADGGEGTLDAFAGAVPDSRRVPSRVTGPDDREIAAEWLLLPDGTGVVELALASGLTLLDPLRPLDAHTLGFGQLIAAALDGGATRLVLALGGSASTDGGAGMLTALGAAFFDSSGNAIARGNRGLADLADVDLRRLRLFPVGTIALSDVSNPLLDPQGAAAVFGPQKGATAEQCAVMNSNLARLARVLDAGDLAESPGAGAAGGTGFALLRSQVPLEPGAAAIGRLLGMPAAVASADLVITGEGRFDSQSASGKVAHYLASLAEDVGTDAAMVAGSIEAPADAFVDSIALTELAGDAATAQRNAGLWLAQAGARLATRFGERTNRLR